MEEGANLLVNLTARANPAQVEYKWTNPDRATVPAAEDAFPDARMTAVAGALNVTAARRGDRGRYKVRASNSEGKTTIKFRIDVQYGPT